MKLKILITPFCIAISIIVLIWFIYPAYSDPASSSGVSDKLEILKAQKTRITEIEQRTDNAERLASALSSNPDSATVFSYIPDSEKEEDIIGSLNAVASANGLLVYNLSLENDPASKNAQAAQGMAATDGSSSADASDPANQAVDAKPQPRTASVNLSLIGSYGSIKNVLASLYKFKRFNQLKSMTIKIMRDQDANPSGNLKADLVIGFNYLEKDRTLTDSDVQNSVFLTDKFNTSVIDDLKTVRTGEIAKIESGQAGKENPFAP